MGTSDLLGQLHWRYAVKKFDATRSIPSMEELRAALVNLERQITAKTDPAAVTATAEEADRILQGPFGLSLRRQGKSSQVIEEAALEVRTLLGESLQAAKAGQWAQAASLRLEAYTTLDLEIEKRVLPRDPNLVGAAARKLPKSAF
jgi:hypothetical protein